MLVEAAAVVANAPVVRVLGDTAYGNSETRKKLAAMGIEVLAKAPPANSKGGTYRRTDFEIDEKLGVATCPAGKETIRRSPQREMEGGWNYHYSRKGCTPSALRELCTKSETLTCTVTDSPRARELGRHGRRRRDQNSRRPTGGASQSNTPSVGCGRRVWARRDILAWHRSRCRSQWPPW